MPAPESMAPSASGSAPTSPKPVVSILIVHFRTPELLETCLGHIAAAGVGVPSETIVVDNAPLGDAAAGVCERFGAQYILNRENIGYGRAVNQGMEAARGLYFLILNPDVEVRAGSVEALATYLDEHPGAGLVGPKLFSPDGSLQYSARTFYTLKTVLLRRTFLGRLFPHSPTLREHLMLDWDHNDVREVDWMLGGALMVRREAVGDVGGMDERFFLYFEDVDWCSRMKRRGWQVVYVADAQMIHAHQRASARGFLSPGKRMHLESALRFYEKWSLVLYLGKKKSTELRAVGTILTDILVLSIAFLAAYFTRYLLGTWIPGWSAAKPVFALKVYARFIPFADLVAIGCFYFLGLYRGVVWRDRWREFLQLLKGISIVSVVVMASTFLFTTRPLSRFTILLFFPYSLILLVLARELLRRVVREVRGRKLHLRRLAVFASQPRIEQLKGRFAEHGTFGYEPLYLAHDDETRHPRDIAADPVERRLRFIENERIAEIAVFEGEEDRRLIDDLMPSLLASGVPVIYVPRGEAFLLEGRRLGDFMGYGAVSMGGRSQVVGHWLKRTCDVIAALLLLVLGLPLHLWQLLAAGRGCLVERPYIGRRGRRFSVRVYRSSQGPAARIPGLKNYPALTGVLAGSLSFVGIAPLTPEQWEAAERAYRNNPPDAPVGIVTEMASAPFGEVAGVAHEGQILAYNRRYVTGWSLSEDLRILLKAVYRAKGKEGDEA